MSTVNFVIFFKEDVDTTNANLYSVVNQIASEGTVKKIDDKTVVVLKTSNFTGVNLKKSLSNWCIVESFVDGHPRVNGANFK